MTTPISQFAQFALTMEGFATDSTDILLEATLTTPFVKYSKYQRKLTISGKSTANSITSFYNPIISLLKRDTIEKRSVSLSFNLIDFNTQTLQVLFDLFKYLNLKKQTGAIIDIEWKYALSNQEIKETGQDFSELFDLNFRVVGH